MITVFMGKLQTYFDGFRIYLMLTIYHLITVWANALELVFMRKGWYKSLNTAAIPLSGGALDGGRPIA